MLIELSVELIQPLLIAKIIDDGIVAGDVDVIWAFGGGHDGARIRRFFIRGY